MRLKSLVFALCLGALLGGAIGYGCSFWIKRKQFGGNLRLGFWPAVIISVFVLSRGLFTPCDLFGSSESDPKQKADAKACASTFSVFEATTRSSILWTLYLWGIMYERKAGLRLIYRIPFIEKDPEVARARKHEEDSK
jgi:hypothetical protein